MGLKIPHQLLLHELRAEVPPNRLFRIRRSIFCQTIGSHDRQRDVVPHARCLLVLKEVAHGSVEEVHRSRFLEGGGVRYIDDHRSVFQDFGKSLACESVDT